MQRILETEMFFFNQFFIILLQGDQDLLMAAPFLITGFYMGNMTVDDIGVTGVPLQKISAHATSQTSHACRKGI